MPRAHWILAVLQDLRRYAETNGMVVLTSELEAAIEAAIEELPLAEEPPATSGRGIKEEGGKG